MESDKKLKVGVLGVGALGRHHARLYAQSPNAEMVGIFDVQPETAAKVGGGVQSAGFFPTAGSLRRNAMPSAWRFRPIFTP